MKGLHKNSLRKVDNLHQWMIDDARMELIQQIKAKVERRIKRNKEEYAPDGLFEVQDNLAKLLADLSTLESKKPVPNDLEEAAENYEKEHTYQRYDGGGLTPEYDATLAEAVIFGAKWQKVQLMKEAVEGVVTTRSMAGNIVTAHIDHQFTNGQKVKLIIVKED